MISEDVKQPQLKRLFRERFISEFQNRSKENFPDCKGNEIESSDPAIISSFMQSFPSLCVSPGCDDSPSFTVNQHLSFDGVRKSVSDLKKRVEEICQEEFNKIRPQDDNEKIFNEMISSLEKRRSEVTEMIRVQEKADLSRAEQHLKHLKQEITDLQRRVSDLEQLSHTPDHIHFLQSFPSLCVSPGCDDSPSFTVNQHLSFDGVRKGNLDLKKRVEEICQEEFNKIRPQDFCYLTLDPNTAHPQLILSEKKKSRDKTKLRYSDYPERLDFYAQVLCKQ
ncbi:finTRIM family, member 14 [Silurus meridionalis]|nr:finTRIM family, member 14 [Silurus meridionalis]